MHILLLFSGGGGLPPPIIIPNGRWRPIIDTNFGELNTASVIGSSVLLYPFVNEEGFAIFFLTPNAPAVLRANEELRFISPSGNLFSPSHSQIYSGINLAFTGILPQGTFTCYVSHAGDFYEVGTWAVALYNNGIPVSGFGYFPVG